MYYNKLFGLHTLEHALTGIDGAGVLPYQVYSNPKEILAKHYRGFPRILIRTDTVVDAPEEYWMLLPRIDVDTSSGIGYVRNTMQHLRNYWQSIATPPARLRTITFIAHPVLPRKEYLANGRITALGQTLQTHLSRTNSETWRESAITTLAEVARNAGMSTEQQAATEQLISRARAALLRHVQASPEFNKTDLWEASFTIRLENGRPRIEFYDFLRKPGA